MKLTDLLAHEDFMDGLAAIYKEYSLLEEEEENDPNDPTISFEESNDRKKFGLIKQKYGWSFSDLWGLDDSFFKFLLPRLYVFYKVDVADRNHSYNEDGRWDEIVQSILEMILLNLDNDGGGFTKEELKVHVLGMTLLTRYIRKLWI